MNLPRRVERIEARTNELLRVRAVRAPEPVKLDTPADVLALAVGANDRGDRDPPPSVPCRPHLRGNILKCE